jgi:hypothetical protein
MINFKLTNDVSIVHGSDGRAYSVSHPDYISWMAAGGVPLPADPISPNAAILSQIATLEGSITPRRHRDALLTLAGKTWLTGVDAQISVLRATLV